MKKGAALVLLNKDGSIKNYSWQHYSSQAKHASRALIHFGINKGDFIVIAAPNLPESFFVMLGIIAIGAVPVPINIPLLKEPGQKEFKHILNDCRPKLILASSCLSKYLTDTKHMTFEDLLLRGSFLQKPADDKTRGIETNPNKLLIMLYTSGTTGQPKGVMLSRKNISNRVRAIVKELKVTRQERIFSYLLLGHISELIATFFGQLEAGYTVFFSEYSGEILENREQFRAAFPDILQVVKPPIFLAVPKVWENMRKSIEKKTRFLPIQLNCRGVINNFVVKAILKKIGFNQTRFFVSAGSKLSQKDKQFFEEIEVTIDDIYGQTETAGPLTLNGKTVGNTNVSLGENDEILVTGPNVMLGYYNNPKATAEVIKNGFYHTGDIGLRDSEGRIFYAGRMGDKTKNSQGEFVDPIKIEELENEIKQIRGVDEVVIFCEGKPHPIALVFTSKPHKNLELDLKKLLPQIGGGFYKIDSFLIVDSNLLELTPTLKVKRKAMFRKFEKEIEKL
ncbi:MAG: AMP-binding protein [Candidatus Yanofskybacteria bacterium]|nr:AMP-binding protein [Candidatus Yanofskybacteria bacterium]